MIKFFFHQNNYSFRKRTDDGEKIWENHSLMICPLMPLPFNCKADARAKYLKTKLKFYDKYGNGSSISNKDLDIAGPTLLLPYLTCLQF